MRLQRVAAALTCAAATLVAGVALAASPPATLEGHPNITGDWSRYGGFRPVNDPRLAAPPPGELQLKPAYASKYAARRAAERASDAAGAPIAGAGVDCLPYGMPEMMSAIYPLEILQTPGQVTIIAEAFSQVRRIYLDSPQGKIGDVAPGYYGHSVGHWEGDTLVVDTIGVKPEVLGHDEMPHSDQMRVEERFHLVSPEVLHDQITVEDPVTLEKPWTFTFAYKRMQNYEMLEYVCENNHEYVDDKGVTHVRLQDPPSQP
ncbi:MAG TPA: hypothetical protein VHX52_06345 [Steroidobacteraceae bacterium]|nr:hypothetical protein [Steroidobacteraceae bacterium]